ncbi:MAG: hypothetical protein HY922_05175 [Elusimicrobia bacterium]|nr:hypothetical protein [Elusimicrobiota bacterium]
MKGFDMAAFGIWFHSTIGTCVLLCSLGAGQAYGDAGNIQDVDFDQGRLKVENFLNASGSHGILDRCVEQMRSAVTNIPIPAAFKACRADSSEQMVQCVDELYPSLLSSVSEAVNVCLAGSHPSIVACAQLLALAFVDAAVWLCGIAGLSPYDSGAPQPRLIF